MSRKLQSPQSETARNVHLYNDDGEVVGGTFQHGSLKLICTVYAQFFLSFLPQRIRIRGEFLLYATMARPGPLLRKMVRLSRPEGQNPIGVRPTDRQTIRRIRSQSGTTHRLSAKQRYFRDAVRNRDEACVATGYSRDDFVMLEAAHIFPVARQQEWRRQGYDSWITDTSPTRSIGDDKSFSPQNGLLLQSAVHRPFDLYEFGINPADGYKITVFHKQDTLLPIDGKFISARCTSQCSANKRVSDQALRWHFEQAVLKNMKGAAGERWPHWEDDFGEGCDQIAEIAEGPEPGERMELELEDRFAGWTEHERVF